MNSRKAFTLVELLVVVAIISVLAAMLLPTLQDAMRLAYRTECANNMKQQYLAATLYAADFNDCLPKNEGAYSQNYIRSCNKSTKLWCEQYLGIQLYSDPVRYGGAAQPWHSDASRYFAAPDDKGVLGCPGSGLHASATNLDTTRTACSWFEYSFAGFSPYEYRHTIESTWPATRLTRIAEPYKGAPKIFLIDHYESNTAAAYAFGYAYLNNHWPSNPEGSNVAEGSGSVAWTDFRTTRYPQGYWGIFGYDLEGASSTVANPDWNLKVINPDSAMLASQPSSNNTWLEQMWGIHR